MSVLGDLTKNFDQVTDVHDHHLNTLTAYGRVGANASHYLDQCWNIYNSTLRDRLRWNCNRNSYIFIQENAFETVFCEMATILSRPQYVNAHTQYHISRNNTLWIRGCVFVCMLPLNPNSMGKYFRCYSILDIKFGKVLYDVEPCENCYSDISITISVRTRQTFHTTENSLVSISLRFI